MVVTGSIEDVRQLRGQDIGLAWGFVPTMGYLHAGHLALVRRARAQNERVAVSVFVNPAQFAPHEDLDSYPRDLERDLELLIAEGVDLVFVPEVEAMYPPGFQTYVVVAEVARPLEGSSRPTHFRGVATVVAKLFNIVQPTRAYFGQKDAQQAVVVKQMVRDLSFDVDVIICPTVRELDGLAMSSRNQYLSAEQREAAPALYRALSAAKSAFESGQHNGERLREIMRGTIAAEPLARIDYVSVADMETLEEIDYVEGESLLSMAVYFGKTRLIDNLVLSGG